MSQFKSLISSLSEESCPVANIFVDWNPLYGDDYSTSKGYDNEPYTPAEDEPSLFAKLISDAKKLQVCFLRANNLTDRDLKQICQVLKPESGVQMNRNLKVLDLSSNRFSGEAVRDIAIVFEVNRNLEFVGLAKNNLKTEDVLPMLKCLGRQPFPADKVAQHQAELKARDAIIEKNKKQKAAKKPEEPVPVLDNLESEVQRDENGTEVTVWYLLRNPQFKHLNLCLNQITDDILDRVEELLLNSTDDFGLTLAGNPLNPARVKEIQVKLEKLHRKRHADALKTDPGATLIDDIAQKRLAF